MAGTGSMGGGQGGAPSTVTTCMPSTAYSGHRHALTERCNSDPSSATLDTITVHAPHPPSPHPSFVPVSPISVVADRCQLRRRGPVAGLPQLRKREGGDGDGGGSHRPVEAGTLLIGERRCNAA